ncbi:MAG: dethiobiotin synthase [Solirubrobacteraceae bacterium]
MARGLFVTGTDTGVGKTVLSACLLAAIVAAGERARAYKPVVTGLDEPPVTGLDDPAVANLAAPATGADGDAPWPHDHALLASLCGLTPEEVSPLRFGPAVAPHLAAELAGEPLTGEQLLDGARQAVAAAMSTQTALVVEGVGGLLVPLAHDLSVRQLAVELALPLLVAARPSLGTINHTLLTLEAARGAGLHVRAVVLTPWRADGAYTLERSNRETIARLGHIEVATLPPVAEPTPAALAAAGAALPWRRWLGVTQGRAQDQDGPDALE